MKKIVEYTDGFRWVDGNTSSASFERDSTQYKELTAEGAELVLIPQAEKDAYQALQVRATFKAERTAQVQALTITTQAGNEFDADEISQGRMARAIIALADDEVVNWVLTDNTVINASKAELTQALQLAGAAQAALWI